MMDLDLRILNASFLIDPLTGQPRQLRYEIVPYTHHSHTIFLDNLRKCSFTVYSKVRLLKTYIEKVD